MFKWKKKKKESNLCGHFLMLKLVCRKWLNYVNVGKFFADFYFLPIFFVVDFTDNVLGLLRCFDHFTPNVHTPQKKISIYLYLVHTVYLFSLIEYFTACFLISSQWNDAGFYRIPFEYVLQRLVIEKTFPHYER